nr:sigma-70 family RNA polymerase sigma factor [Mycoplana dimorpha]
MPALRNFARRLCRTSSSADDLVQETLVKAIANLDKFQEGTRLKSWLFTIMRNTFCTNAKIERRESPSLVDDCSSFAPSTPAGQEWHLRAVECQRALSRLTPEGQMLVKMVVVDGVTYEVAAERLNCSIGTIKSRLFRIRARLARELHQEERRSNRP